MNKETALSDLQKQHIEATLVRIRGGLAKQCDPNLEPAHIFIPEIFSDRTIEY
ncbi:hypothetical protein [uncultured Sneathiella sp.]|jgi:hypothetical protein|uniref:hypothetical protein n=1 Tax=uncultured Sneathiella sp. TaxID=879315 RepID=UPI0030D996FE